jgi:putative peptide zinc metalloprotease protein
VFGGPIAVREDDRGRLIPETGVYRVVLRPEVAQAPGQVVVGTARVAADPVSPLGRLWRAVAAVLIRESGF